MRISRLVVRNYRNIKSVDIAIAGTTAVIGENNSGKSNLLRALTLPLFSEENPISKNLSWEDINEEAKEKYYTFISENKTAIVSGMLEANAISDSIPSVCVEINFRPEGGELYYVKDLSTGVENGEITYGLRYEYKLKRVDLLLECLKESLSDDSVDISKIKRSLLPIDLYSYSIVVPGKESGLSYDTLKQFRYIFLPAERDTFSYENNKIGSKSLIKLLEMKFSNEDRVAVEKEYTHFFEVLKGLGGMEDILNWQESSEIPNATEFVKNISILPNMPAISTILNSVRLGYNSSSLSLQGLGQRNLILLLVLLNAIKEPKVDVAFNVLIMEEPEAHLCINNERLMCSYINSLTKESNSIHMFFSTHSTEFISKHDLKNVLVVYDGQVCSLGTTLNEAERGYFSRNPNTDIFKLLFSHRCILVEGISEELLIRAYIKTQPQLSDIDVLSFHKGYTKIMDIWKLLNSGTRKKLGVVRDFDNQPNAQIVHEQYNDSNIYAATTIERTLEPEIVCAGKNYELLKEKYGLELGWSKLSKDELAEDWQKQKGGFMMKLSSDLADGKLSTFTMPSHIISVLEFVAGD